MWKKKSGKLIIFAAIIIIIVKLGKTVRINYQENPQTELLTNLKRVEHMNEVCSNLNETQNLKTLDFSKLLINRKYKFLYCNIPKVSKS